MTTTDGPLQRRYRVVVGEIVDWLIIGGIIVFAIGVAVTTHTRTK
jgi:hypothetical protein